VIASIHASDVGTRSALAELRKTPHPASTPGLRYAVKLLTAPLGGRPLAPPSLGRVGLIAFWDDHDAISRYLDSTGNEPGWHVRLEPIQIHDYASTRGEPTTHPWTGVDEKTRDDPGGPAVVLTLARTRVSQGARFLLASAFAAKPLSTAPGFIWGTALARPPVVATCSLWTSAAALEAYAYGSAVGGHRRAMDADRKKAFHHEGTFIRFHPYYSAGHLTARNPLAADWLTAAPQGAGTER